MDRAACMFVLLGTFLSCQDVQAGLASTWDFCGCSFNEWEAWSDCDSTCFGRRQRTRSVQVRDIPECTEYTDCASNDMGWEKEDCNEVCQNGGTVTSVSLQPCNCQPANYGTCCEHLVDCGYPGDVEHGSVAVSKTTYGGTATYVCEQHYNVTGGDDVRTCQSDFVWSGGEPSCVFVNSCGSGPCQNGATCVNGLDEYTCICPDGWNGQNCEHDILPPVVANCSEDMLVYATDITHNVSWTEPTFHDPRGHEVKVTKNYNDPAFEFPWGDFTVQYVAMKSFNGLETNCTFDIHVRPTPCPNLNVPANGVRLCNGWAKDYGLYCILACRENYTIGPAEFYGQWYVCGASGNWMAGAPMPDCEVEIASADDALVYHAHYTQYTFPSCDGNDVTDMKRFYLEKLAAVEFASICTDNEDLCDVENVDIGCGF